MTLRRLIPWLALVVFAMWSLTILDGMVTHDYTPLGAVTPVMLIVAGFVFGFRRADEGGYGYGRTPEDPPEITPPKDKEHQ